MEVIHARCAGLDVHKQMVVACVRVTTAGRAQHEVRTFATTAAGLRALQEWLGAVGCTHAVLESTGAYWKGHEAHLTGAGMKAACGSVGRCGAG
jgi:transposase